MQSSAKVRCSPTFRPGLIPRENPCEDVAEEAESRPPIYLLSLPGTEAAGLAFADPAEDLRRTEPEVRVWRINESTGSRDEWFFRRTLMAEGSDDQVFTLEDGTWRRIVGRWLGGEERIHRDYASGSGFTVRFGDGEFGRVPDQDSLFVAQYRLGSGSAANVPAGSVSSLSDAGPA